MTDTARILTVAQVNEYVKYLLDSASVLKTVTVRGEISNFKNHYQSGHYYFTLKDSDSQLRSVMFRSSAQKLPFIPQDGMRVLATGRISAFVRDGQYQLYCDAMVPDGVGALAVAYEQLKQRLAAEGLFAEARKKPLPPIPARVGIITSPTGAAVRDLISVSGRRFPAAEIILYPVLVQGDGAPPQLIEAIRYFNRTKRADVLIIGRGGGSLEDLWAFNNEGLVREIARSEIPVISAVGHETDFTLCDFVADRRAPTPSAAAEIALPDREELCRRLARDASAAGSALRTRLEAYRKRLEALAAHRVLSSPLTAVEEKRTLLLREERALARAAELALSRWRRRFAESTAKLQALDPMSVITRGYAAVYTDEGVVVRSVKQLRADETIRLRVSDGTVTARVLETEAADAAAQSARRDAT